MLLEKLLFFFNVSETKMHLKVTVSQIVITAQVVSVSCSYLPHRLSIWAYASLVLSIFNWYLKFFKKIYCGSTSKGCFVCRGHRSRAEIWYLWNKCSSCKNGLHSIYQSNGQVLNGTKRKKTLIKQLKLGCVLLLKCLQKDWQLCTTWYKWRDAWWKCLDKSKGALSVA